MAIDEDHPYTRLSFALGILETHFVKPRREPLREERRAVRLLVIDPNRATWDDWLIWQSMGAARKRCS